MAPSKIPHYYFIKSMWQERYFIYNHYLMLKSEWNRLVFVLNLLFLEVRMHGASKTDNQDSL